MRALSHFDRLHTNSKYTITSKILKISIQFTFKICPIFLSYGRIWAPVYTHPLQCVFLIHFGGHLGDLIGKEECSGSAMRMHGFSRGLYSVIPKSFFLAQISPPQI